MGRRRRAGAYRVTVSTVLPEADVLLLKVVAAERGVRLSGLIRPSLLAYVRRLRQERVLVSLEVGDDARHATGDQG